MKIYLLAALGLILVAPTFLPAKPFQTAYVQQFDKLFASLEYSDYKSEHIWNHAGKKKPAHDDFHKEMLDFYSEYGLTHCDTISIEIVWGRIHETLNGRLFGYGDFNLGWKRQFGEIWSHVIAAEVDVIIPVNYHYDPGLRYGKVGASISGLASRGFYLCDRLAWYDLRLGYVWYSGFPSDQILADAVFNYNVISDLYLQVGVIGEFGLLNGQDRNDRSLFFFNPNYRHLIGRFEATYRVFKGFAIAGGYDRYFWGRNAGTGGRFYARAQYQF